LIQIYLNEKDDSEEYVYADDVKIVGCDKYIVSGECECNGESNTFTIDTQKGKIIALEKIKKWLIMKKYLATLGSILGGITIIGVIYGLVKSLRDWHTR